MRGSTVSVLLMAVSGSAFAQVTISQAVEKASRNYPSIRVTVEQSGAAAAGIQLARTAYLPRIDFLAQLNRASRNNVTGLLFPQSILPSISGWLSSTSASRVGLWGTKGLCREEIKVRSSTHTSNFTTWRVMIPNYSRIYRKRS